MDSKYYVAIFGGAVAGSEAALQLSQNGVRVVVFEQKPLPYGKIELGLPKWHYKLRDRQEAAINERLQSENVQFVPKVQLGKDLKLEEVLEEWGVSAVLLATGAWKDRPLPVEGIDAYFGKGFYYQNPMCEWFNNNHDPNYTERKLSIPDGAIIIGGGLASIDVCKMTMIESVRAELEKRDIRIDALTLEHKGIIPLLEEMDLSLEKLGMKGCTLFTRHMIEEMPISPLPPDPSEEDIKKAGILRRKMLTKVQDKYGFSVRQNRIAKEKIVKDGRLKGLIFEEDVVAPGAAKTEERVETELVISAIGSIPEPIPGIPREGETYLVKDLESGQLDGYNRVFVLGNAVTGRGNIRHSQSHSRQVSENIANTFMAMDSGDYENLFDNALETSETRVQNLLTVLESTSKCTPEQIARIDQRIAKLQDQVGYDGAYEAWIKKHLPLRLEDMNKA